MQAVVYGTRSNPVMTRLSAIWQEPVKYKVLGSLVLSMMHPCAELRATAKEVLADVAMMA